MINTTFPYTKHTLNILGQRMAYVEVGTGDPLVFLHGNPTSSYLWRNVLPHLQGLGRCIVPDLIGMGDSAKLPESGPDSYTFFEHRRYLDALLEALGVNEHVTLIVHDWGSVLGFDWANRHRDAVKGIAYLEAIVQPRAWSDMQDTMRQTFQALRSSAGERMVLEDNYFVEVLLPHAILRTLTKEEMEYYRRPFAERGEARRPTLSWPRQIPLDGEPADVTEVVTAYATWLSSADVPKLFIEGIPGTMPQTSRDFCRTWPVQSVITVRGLHFLQEDVPDEIGIAIATWLQTLA